MVFLFELDEQEVGVTTSWIRGHPPTITALSIDGDSERFTVQPGQCGAVGCFYFHGEPVTSPILEHFAQLMRHSQVWARAAYGSMHSLEILASPVLFGLVRAP
jgi:hypothetical protein